ncbi:MAG: hypothetical protein RL033_5659 [Pseudomonadota bacterium]
MRTDPVAECLDGSTIAALVAGGLGADELQQVELHLARCTECADLVCTAAALADDHPTSASGPLGAPGTPLRAEWASLLPRLEGLLREGAPSSTTASASRAASEGRLGERYSLGELIAQGASGLVYRGQDLQSGAPVAIKRLKQHLRSESPEALARFLLEGRILRRLDHPNIVQLLGMFEDGPERYLVMEYVGGGSLRGALPKGRALSPPRSVAIALELADALSRAHHLRVLHRDVKPENVLLAEDGTPRLSDFGLARLADQQWTAPGELLGTIAYMSPEALWGRSTDERADVWSLGVMLFEMLSGQHPFLGNNHGETVNNVLHRALPELDAERLGSALIDLLQRMLEREREQRIASMRQVGAELEQITRELRALPVAASSIPPAPALAAAPRISTSLPVATTPFVGRQSELAELCGLLRHPSTRLVTLVGPGGMGKSRLALEVARALETELHRTRPPETHELVRGRAVCFVDLAPLDSSSRLVPTLADAVGFRFYPGVEPRQQLLSFFREKRLLLLLDNFESVLDATGFVAELLEAAPRVAVLITSRQSLGLQAETLFPLEGLELPAAETSAQRAEAGAESGAIQLFLQGARRVSHGFEVPQEEQHLPHRICELVQGMPLAIVLAASWAGLLSLTEIARELIGGLDFLSTESPDVPPRQRSVRAVFEHSWLLLSPEARTCFAQTSVFRGGFTRGAAEGVAGASLRTLAELVKQSFIRRDPRSGRYQLHEMLRQYASDKLESDADACSAAQERHAHHYAAFLGQRSAALEGGAQREALQDIDAELGNVRAAWLRCLERRELALVEQMLEPLGAFYQRRSLAEGADTFTAVVSALDLVANDAAWTAPVTRTLGRALTLAAFFCAENGQHAQGSAYLQRALALLDEQHPRELALALITAAFSLRGSASPEQTIAHARRGIELLRGLGERTALARALVLQGRVSMHVLGDSAAAERQYSEAIALQRADGALVLPQSLAGLGQVRMLQGRGAESLELIREGLTLAESFADPWSVLACLNARSLAQRSIGDYSGAEASARRALSLCRQYGQAHGELWGQMLLGDALKEQDRLSEARQLYELCLSRAQNDGVVLHGAQLELGNLELAGGDAARADEQFAAALAGYEGLGTSWGTLLALDGLARSACAANRHEQAAQLLHRAYAIASRSQSTVLTLQVVASCALLAARAGRPERAVELLALVDHHSATELATRNRRVRPLLAELGARLPPAELEAAQARGRALELAALRLDDEAPA